MIFQENQLNIFFWEWFWSQLFILSLNCCCCWVWIWWCNGPFVAQSDQHFAQLVKKRCEFLGPVLCAHARVCTHTFVRTRKLFWDCADQCKKSVAFILMCIRVCACTWLLQVRLCVSIWVCVQLKHETWMWVLLDAGDCQRAYAHLGMCDLSWLLPIDCCHGCLWACDIFYIPNEIIMKKYLALLFTGL